jgi:hypothetical protein
MSTASVHCYGRPPGQLKISASVTMHVAMLRQAGEPVPEPADAESVTILVPPQPCYLRVEEHRLARDRGRMRFPRAGRSGNYGRAEELLRRGYSTSGVRDREAIAEWLQLVCEETCRPREAREFGQQAKRLRRQGAPTTVSRKLELAGQDDEAAVLREAVTLTFGGEGLPLGQLPDAMRAAAKAPAGPMRAAKVGRNAPCPCRSGRKFKKCCGSIQPTADRG